MNLKEELNEIFTRHPLKCASIKIFSETFELKSGFLDRDPLEYDRFLDSLDFSYDNLHDEITGYIWLTDGNWLSREIDETWLGYWLLHCKPEIPTHLK